MNDEGPHELPSLEEYRPFLLFLAKVQIDPRLRGTIGVEDVVQETLLRAFERRDQLRAQTSGQTKAWLREILMNLLANKVRSLRTQKRDQNLERPIENALQNSSERLEDYLAADHSSPSERAQRNERALLLEDALMNLPERQRQAVVLKHIHGLSMAEIGKEMDLSLPALAGLLNRGLKALRDRLPDA